MKGFLVFAVLVATFAKSDGLTCWENKCRECSGAAAQNLGTEMKCNPQGLVSVKWLDQVDQMIPYSPQAANNETMEYTCLTMVALDPKIGGDSTDIIRGCYRKDDAKNFCSILQDLLREREKTKFECNFCEKDYCNSASTKNAVLFAFISMFFVVKSSLM